MGKFSRDKGKRGELDFVHKLAGSAVRKGHSWVPTLTDVETDFAHYQLKNTTIGGSNICDILLALEKVVHDGKNKYVAFKPRPGIWVICELLIQHIDDHGDEEISNNIPVMSDQEICVLPVHKVVDREGNDPNIPD